MSAERAPAVEGVLTALLRNEVRAAKPGFPQLGELSVRLLDGRRGLSEARSAFRRPLLLLSGFLGILLMLACANVAGLLLVRSTRRRREIATRLALGASPGRIARQLLLESVLLSLAAAALGLGMATWSGGVLLLVLPQASHGAVGLDAALDVRNVALTFAVALLAGLLFGLIPALRSCRLDVVSSLRGRGITDPRSPLGKALVVFQVALSVWLLAGGAVLARSAHRLATEPLGFRPEGLTQFRVSPVLNGYGEEAKMRLAERVLDELRGIPGVMGASVSSHGLLTGESMMATLNSKDAEPFGEGTRLGPAPFVKLNLVDAEFFRTAQIDLLRGRAIDGTDTKGAPRAAVLNERFARRLFGPKDPLGHTIGLSGNRVCTIVGVVRDAKYTSVKSEPPEMAYLAIVQHPARFGSLTFAVRSSATVEGLHATIRGAIFRVDPSLPVFGLASSRELVARSTRQERVLAGAALALAVFATLLACLGLYGLMSYLVSCRTAETGVRIALGASHRDVVSQVMRESLGLAGLGAVLAVPAVLASGRFAQELLFGISPRDPMSTLAAIVAMLGVASVAAFVPALRASRVEPSVALRAE